MSKRKIIDINNIFDELSLNENKEKRKRLNFEKFLKYVTEEHNIIDEISNRNRSNSI